MKQIYVFGFFRSRHASVRLGFGRGLSGRIDVDGVSEGVDIDSAVETVDVHIESAPVDCLRNLASPVTL